MSEKRQDPVQPTRPKRGKPAEIPVPKRKDVLSSLKRLAQDERKK